MLGKKHNCNYVVNPKNWTQNGAILFNLNGYILPDPIILKFNRG